MSTFLNFVNNLKNSFDIKYLKKIKEVQLEIIEKITKSKQLQSEILICMDVLERQYEILEEQSKTLINLCKKENELYEQIDNILRNKDKNSQNLYAKKHGVKSAIQYKILLKNKSNHNELKIREEQLQLKKCEKQKIENQIERKNKLLELQKIEKDIESQKQELYKVNNAIKYYRYNRLYMLFSSISVLMLCACFIFSQINQLNNTFKITICSIAISIIAIVSICLFINENKIRKLLQLKKCNYFSFVFALIVGISAFFTLFNNYILHWTSTFFLICSSIFILFNIYHTVQLAEKDSLFKFEIDYPIFNLPIINFVIIYIIYLLRFEKLFNYISAGCLILIFAMYVIGFCWTFKIKKSKVKVTFKYCLEVFLNLIICCAVLGLIIINLATTINVSEQFFSWLNIIFIIIGAFAGPILNNLFKTNINDPLDKNKKE